MQRTFISRLEFYQTKDSSIQKVKTHTTYYFGWAHSQKVLLADSRRKMMMDRLKRQPATMMRHYSSCHWQQPERKYKTLAFARNMHMINKERGNRTRSKNAA